MASNLMIVARDETDLHAFLQRDFADEPLVEVLFDRRRGDRRRGGSPSPTERRRGERRTRADVQSRLVALGYVFIHVA